MFTSMVRETQSDIRAVDLIGLPDGHKPGEQH